MSPLIRRHWIVVGYLLLAGCMIVLYLGYRGEAQKVKAQAALGAQTHAAVCTFRSDLKHRDAAGMQFLRDHPDGALGVTVKVLRSQVAQQQKAIRSLAGLRCP